MLGHIDSDDGHRSSWAVRLGPTDAQALDGKAGRPDHPDRQSPSDAPQ
jgi:hypothetical protein